MGHSDVISNEEYARLELYAELQKGLEDIKSGNVLTSEEVRQHMESRRKIYQDADI